MAGGELMPAILFRVNGTLVPAVRFQSVSIHDVLGATPNTATLTFDNRAVHADVGAAIQIGAGSLTPPDLLFAGQVQHLIETYQSDVRKVRLTEWPADLIDHVFAINRRRPFASYVNQSATTIAQALVSGWAPGFTTTHVQAGLPTLTINFDGSTPLMECLNQVAQAVGGRTKIDYLRDVHLFVPPEAGIPDPDPITIGNPPLNVPPIQFDVDLSQVRTRVYGKGHGEPLLADVAASETLLPVEDVSFFAPGGGRAIAGITSDGATTQQLTYTGTQAGGAGTVVGTGAAPTTAPTITAAAGGSVTVGEHLWAYTWVTAAGETLPSPWNAASTAPLANPTTAPTPSAPTSGGAVTPGSHSYGITFENAVGESAVGPLSGSVVVTGQVAAPLSMPNFQNSTVAKSGTEPQAGHNYRFRYTFYESSTGGQTTPSPAFADVLSDGTRFYMRDEPETGTGVRVWYVSKDGGAFVHLDVGNGPNEQRSTGGPGNPSKLMIYFEWWSTGDAIPTTNTTGSNQTVPLTAIPTGPAGTVTRRLYRTAANGATLQRLTQLPNNTATTYTDTAADATLGSTAPTSNTTATTGFALAAIATGPAAVTARKIYRTPANQSATANLKLLTTLANNTATTYTDLLADASLGAAPPGADTSGLTQPTGQVNAGATSVPTASAAAFASTGGWARAGQVTFRYTGITGNTLTGVPASGPGAITITITYGAQIVAAPVLVGVAGLTRALQQGSSVNLFVQRDDVAAQLALGQLERNPNGTPTDGIREYLIADERRGEASLAALCDADLAAFARPIVGVTYATRDPKSKAGQVTTIDLRVGATGVFNPAIFNPAVFHTGSAPGLIWGYSGAYLIQEVTITIDPTADPLPRYLVRASSSRFTFQDLLQRVALVS